MHQKTCWEAEDFITVSARTSS